MSDDAASGIRQPRESHRTQAYLAPDGTALVLPLGGRHAVLSWAVVNGGRTVTDTVVWRGLRFGELRPEMDPVAVLKATLLQTGHPDAVGLMTSGALAYYEDSTCSDAEWSARCVTTVGMSNALSAGDPPGPLVSAVGTINTVCVVSHPLSENGLVEAIALAAEARTAAILEARVTSRRSQRFATGTGTDCIVMAAPETGARQPYVGKHTALGAVLGAAVRDATARGVATWKERAR